MNLPRWAFAFAALASLASPARADSPLTSIDFTSAYPGLAQVQAAKKRPVPAEVFGFLASGAPNDQKAAVVNALGWNFHGQKNATLFLQALARDRNLDPERLETNQLSPSDSFVAGYLAAMDDYLRLGPIRKGGRGVWGKKPGEILDVAATALPEDFTVQYVRALVAAQAAMDGPWCNVYQLPQTVLDRFPVAQRNLKPAAVEAAQAYLAGYATECKGSQAKAIKDRDQIYALARLGSQIVAGTQGGVVVWNAGDVAAPAATFDGFICSRVVVFQGAAWAGCDQQVVNWDGHAFKSYLKNDASDAEYYAPMLGPNGQLWVRYGGKTWSFDPQGDRFVSVKAPWTGSPYDALVTGKGEACWIDFLSSFTCGQRKYAFKSAEYPGRDPRRFREDAAGRLWVEDFESGLFRRDDDGAKFVHEDGLSQRGTGVGFDPRSERLWMLHYTQGVFLKHSGKVEPIDLAALGNLRDLLLDGDGAWVAGWGQLVHLVPQDGGWLKESYRVK